MTKELGNAKSLLLLVGMVVVVYYLFKGKDIDESGFEGAAIGPRSRASHRASVRSRSYKQGCCSTPCSQMWENSVITSLTQLGKCVRNRCNLK